MPSTAIRSGSAARADRLGAAEMRQEGALAGAPTPGISSSGVAPTALARLARWAPIRPAVRLVAQALDEVENRVVALQRQGASSRGGGIPLSRRRGRCPWRRRSWDVVDPQFGHDPGHRRTCPAPPSISSRSGQLSRFRSGSSFRRRSKRRVSTSRIMPKSSLFAPAADLMLNLRYCDFRSPRARPRSSRPRHRRPGYGQLS
jgi:hypothetical protein